MKTEKDLKYYVTMTDKFLSFWGESKDRINKLVIVCNTIQEANYAYNKALNRFEMKHVNICENKPSYNKNRYHVSWYTKNNARAWYSSDSL